MTYSYDDTGKELVEYTTRKGNVLNFTFHKECFTGFGADAQYGHIYKGMCILDPAYEDLQGDTEIQTVQNIAENEGLEALETYIAETKPKKYKIDVCRDYICRYTSTFEVVATNREQAQTAAEENIKNDFNGCGIHNFFSNVVLYSDRGIDAKLLY